MSFCSLWLQTHARTCRSDNFSETTSYRSAINFGNHPPTSRLTTARNLVHVTLVPPRISKWHKGDMNKFPYWSPTNIRRHRTKCTRTAFAHPWINGDSENSQSHHEMCTSQHSSEHMRRDVTNNTISQLDHSHVFPSTSWMAPNVLCSLSVANIMMSCGLYHRSSHVMSRRYDSRCQWHTAYTTSRTPIRAFTKAEVKSRSTTWNHTLQRGYSSTHS